MSCLVCPSWGPCKCAGGPVLPVVAPSLPKPSVVSRALKTVLAKPRINIRQKGATGEREVINAMLAIVHKAMRAEGYSEAHVAQAANCIQRNQNQSAVGGNDLSHTFGMSIEVKRQEQLAVNAWWKQTLAAATPNNELPILIYRQNQQAWRVVTMGSVHLPGVHGSDYGSFNARVEIDWPTFQAWFEQWVIRKLRSGELPRGVKV